MTAAERDEFAPPRPRGLPRALALALLAHLLLVLALAWGLNWRRDGSALEAELWAPEPMHAAPGGGQEAGGGEGSGEPISVETSLGEKYPLPVYTDCNFTDCSFNIIIHQKLVSYFRCLFSYIIRINPKFC